MTTTIFRLPYGDRLRVAFNGNPKTMTKQAQKAECDINNIMAKYAKTGLLSHVSKYNGEYSDVVGIGDYRDCLDTIQNAKEAFSSLPAQMRKRFLNDPAVFLDFVEDPKNAEEMVTLGLAVRKAEKPAADGSEPAPATAGA